jgi:enoyl-CoA hydratase/carnithine racemase
VRLIDAENVRRSLKVPVIAAINGVCFGAAFQVALGACIRVAHPEAKFSILEISHGLIPDMAISSTARHVIREDFLKLMAYSGEAIDAKTAQAYGVVTLIDDEPLQRAHKLAAQFAKYSPAAIRANKRLIQQAVFAEDLRGLRVEEELQLSLIRSQEFQDRMRNTIAQRRSKK